MKKRFEVFFFIFSAFVVIIATLNIKDKKSVYIGQNAIEKIERDAFKEYKKKFSLSDKDFAYLWGIKDKAINTPEMSVPDAKSNLRVQKTKNRICIDTNCFDLIAVYNKNNISYVVFFSNSFKKSIKSFNEGDTLYGSVMIKEINNNQIILKNTKDSKEFKFKYFDVNISKYTPKDVNET